MAGVIEDFDTFVRVHGVLLASAGLPRALYEQLFQKLSGQVLDGGSFFQIELCESNHGRQRRLILSSVESLTKHSQVFLVDHAWSFRLTEARKQLQDHPRLLERLGAMMCVNDEDGNLVNENHIEDSALMEDIITKAKQMAEEDGDTVMWLELDDAGIDDNKLSSLELSIQFPTLVGLSLWGNELESKDVLLEAISGLKGLKALWVNGNPVDVKGGKTLANDVMSALPQLEIYNSSFTESYDSWAVHFASGIASKNSHITGNLKDVTLLDLSNRNIRILQSKIFNPIEMPFLTSLNLKGNPLDYDTRSNMVGMLRGFPNLQSLEARISNNLYTLDKSSFTEYETHFTVMNYGRKLVHVNTHDFVQVFEEQHKVNWRDIHQRIRSMIRSVFEGAFTLHPEMHSSRSRAIYGVDVLLDSSFEPKLLEVTYCPDCTRACKYDMKNVLGNGDLIIAKDFFNDVFGCLFLNDCKNVTPL